jgi:hypothetical protein
MTAQDHANQATGTLNIYDDNRVLFNTAYRASGPLWGWTTNKDAILAVRVRGRIYNAKDIAGVTYTQASSGPLTMTIRLKSGEVVSESVRPWTADKFSFWLSCNTQKVCQDRVNTSMGQQIITGVYESDLNNPALDPKYRLVRDYRAVPLDSGITEVRFLPYDDKLTIDRRIEMQARSAKEHREEPQTPGASKPIVPRTVATGTAASVTDRPQGARCPSGTWFDLKGSQGGVTYGDCHCGSEILRNVTSQACNAAALN